MGRWLCHFGNIPEKSTAGRDKKEGPLAQERPTWSPREERGDRRREEALFADR
jgi:hypothetical protein